MTAYAAPGSAAAGASRRGLVVLEGGLKAAAATKKSVASSDGEYTPESLFQHLNCPEDCPSLSSRRPVVSVCARRITRSSEVDEAGAQAAEEALGGRGDVARDILVRDALG